MVRRAKTGVVGANPGAQQFLLQRFAGLDVIVDLLRKG